MVDTPVVEAKGEPGVFVVTVLRLHPISVLIVEPWPWVAK